LNCSQVSEYIFNYDKILEQLYSFKTKNNLAMEQQITNQKATVVVFVSTTSRLKKIVVGHVLTICLFASCILGSNNLIAQDKAGTFILSGTIENAENPYLYLLYESTPGIRLKDSSRIVDNKFQFKGVIPEPTKAILRENPHVIVNGKVIADETNLNFVGIFLEKGTMNARVVHDDFKSTKLFGSKTHNESVRHNELRSLFQEQYIALRGQLELAGLTKSRKVQIDSLTRLYDEAIRGMMAVTQKFIYDNPDSYFSAYELRSYRNMWPLDTVKYLFDNLSPKIKESIDGKVVGDFIREAEAAAVGSMAYDFSGMELDGEAIKLSDFRGKFVLIDFWGSWCAPCREGNPHLIELYNLYKDRNFEIIGIASQDKEEPWRKAVDKDKIGIWKNIIDRDQVSHGLAIAHKYAVHSFPTKILIDKRGKIIGRFSGNDRKKLEELLAKQLK